MKEETKQMGLMKKLTSAIVASSLVFTLVGSASAAYTADAGATAAARMQSLKIVQGLPDGTLGLDKEITRAELVTIIVRAFGQEETAKLLQGSTAGFTDTAKHWASGNIAMAKSLVERAGGDAIGLPDGSFNPDGKLTPAQAVAFLMKFLGVKADPAKAWPANYLDKAADMGLIAADDKAVIANSANTNSTRGLTFYLFDRAFANYTLSTGKTFYTQYVDQTAPELTIKNEAVSTTMDSKVTVTGTVTGASELYVGTTKVTPDASGNFSSDVTLGEVKADPYTITVTARDLAGNKTEKSIKVTRTVGAAASIEASDITVAAGATATVKAVVKDAKGNVLANQAVTGTSDIGTFDGTTFTAKGTAGSGTLTLKAGDNATAVVKVTVNAGALAKVNASATSVAPGAKVTLTATDASGNAVTGVTYTVNSADAIVDSASGSFIASAVGTYTVTGKLGDATATVNIGVFGTADHLVINTPATVVGNYDAADTNSVGSYATVTVSVVDKNGNVLTNSAVNNSITLSGTALTFKGKNSGTATEAAVNGVATFKVYAPATVSGAKISLSATDGTLNQSTSPALEVLAQTAKNVTVDVAKYVATNSASSQAITVKVLDQDGFKMRVVSYPATLAVSGVGSLAAGSSTTSKSITVAAGLNNAESIYVGQGITGNATITATVDGVGTGTATTSAVIAGAPAKITASVNKDSVTAGATGTNVATVTAKVTDANGVPVQGPATLSVDFSAISDTTGLVVLDGNDGTTNVITAKSIARQSDDTYSYTVTTNAAYLGAVPATLKATGLTSTTATTNVVAGVYTQAVMARTTSVYVPVSAPNATITAQLKDSLGNAVKAAGVKVTATAYKTAVGAGAETNEVTLNGTAKTVEAVSDANGVVTFNVVTRPFSSTTYQIALTAGKKADGTALSFSAATPVVVDTAATQSVAAQMYKQVTAGGVTTWEVASYVNAGDTVKFVATVTDTYGANRLANATLSLKSEKIFWDGSALVDGTGVTFSVAGNNWESASLVIAKAGLNTVTVKDTAGPTEVAANTSMLVNATAVSGVKVKEATDATSGGVTTHTVKPAKNSVAGPYTLQLVDLYGNNVTTLTNTSITVTPSATNPATVRTAVDGLNVASISTRSAQTFYASVTDDTTIDFTVGGVTYTLTIDAQ